MEAVRRGETFVTYGPLLEFSVDGKPMGARIALSRSGGTLDVTWQVASVTVPTTRVELMVNGVVRESAPVGPEGGSGSWSVKVEQSSWLALLVRGHYPDQPEIVAAHSSPVMVDVEGTQLLAAADAAVILDQIEGALAYLDTTGTRAGGCHLQAHAPGARKRLPRSAQPHAPEGLLPRSQPGDGSSLRAQLENERRGARFGLSRLYP